MNEPNFFLLPRSFLWSYSGGIGRMMSPISQLCLLIFPAACILDDYHKFSTLNDLYLVTLFNIQFPGLPHPPLRETPASTSPSSPSLSFPGLGCHPGRDQYHHHHHHHHHHHDTLHYYHHHHHHHSPSLASIAIQVLITIINIITIIVITVTILAIIITINIIIITLLP